MYFFIKRLKPLLRCSHSTFTQPPFQEFARIWYVNVHFHEESFILAEKTQFALIRNNYKSPSISSYFYHIKPIGTL
jgi:hypothetical protein